MRQLLLWTAAVIGFGTLACLPSLTWATSCVVADLPELVKSSKVIFVGTLVEGEGPSLRHRFRVTEVFKGTKDKYVDLEEGIEGPGFELGKQYLVFASPCFWKADRHCLATWGPCCATRLLEVTLADVDQLKLKRGGGRMASVYGMVWDRTVRAGRSYEPLPGVIVRLRSAKKTFECRSDSRGVYAFRQIPPGKYQVSADVPTGFILVDTSQYPRGPLEVTRHACERLDVYAESSEREH